jgi:hypothetical protein
MVQANADGASLAQLALDITGNAGDAAALGNVGTITKGKQIDVTNLLNCLEQRLRTNVVNAANYAPKAASFGSPTETSEVPNWSESGVNAVFGIGTPPKTNPRFDCIGMANLIMVRGVIATLNPGEYKAMGFCAADFGLDRNSPGKAGPYLTIYAPPLPRARLQRGDWVVFWNNSRYDDFHPDEDWATENTIMTGPDLYWGWGVAGPGGNCAFWRGELRDAFNSGLANPFDQIGPLGAPGYNQGNDPDQPVTAAFVNVPKLAMALFNFRTKQGQYAGAGP